MDAVRPSVVAGFFYPADPALLRETVLDLLRAAGAPVGDGTPVRGVIAPHAGYEYSGAVAAVAMAALAQRRVEVHRVVLVGPAHHAVCTRPALPSTRAFQTPLGEVPVDEPGTREVLEMGFGEVFDEAHAPEHSLEVLLPFLQVTLGEISIVPILASRGADTLCDALDVLCDTRTAIVVSSDLSHHLREREARIRDAETARRIEALEANGIDGERACGWFAVRAFLRVARQRGLAVRTLRLANSNDAAPGGETVVGYGAFAMA